MTKLLKIIDFFTGTVFQGVLGGLALISAAIILYLNNKVGLRDERIVFLSLKGTNVVLWTFFVMVFILYILNPNEVQIYRKFILNSFYVAISVGAIYSIYQYIKY